MAQSGEHTEAEILSQPDVWAEVLKLLDAKRGELRSFYDSTSFDSVIFTGCGSTYYLSLAAASIFQQLTRCPSRGLPASEVWLNPTSSYMATGKQLLVAVSRSGETTETLRAVDAFKEREHGTVLTISCYPDSTLMQQGDLNLALPPAQEQSIAQTRAFSSLYLAAATLAAICAGRDDLLGQMERLPAIAERLLGDYTGHARRIGADPTFDRFYFLGSGARYGLAAELSLKMKEMSLSHSEPFHFLEFRHGPMSMVTPTTLIIGLLSTENEVHERAVLDEMRSSGASLFTLGERSADVAFASGLDETIQSVLNLPLVQMLAFERSVSKGLNPDQPYNLNAVVKLS